MSDQPVTTTAPPSRLRWWNPLLLIAATLLVYSNSFTGTFIFDDEPHILNDPSIRALTPPRDTWLNTRRPFVKLTLAAHYQLHEFNVVGYHVFNVFVHICAGLVLMGLIRRTLALPQLTERYARAGPWIAASVALIWLVHPVQTQAVTYIIQRAESMMSLMMLLSLYCFLRGATASSWRAAWYALSILACFIAMGTKEVGVVTPVVVLLFDRTFVTQSFARTLGQRWWYHVLMFLPFTGLFWLGLGDINMVGGAAGFGLEHITWKSYLLTQPLVICKYIALLFWPATLSLDRLHPTVDTMKDNAVLGLHLWQLAFAVVTAVFIGSVVAFFRKPWLGFLGLAFFIILAPSSSILPVADVMVEHRVYLVSAIVVLLVVLGVDALLRRYVATVRQRVQLATLCVVVVAACLGARAWVRNFDYQSELSIWRAAAAASPLNARAWNNLGRSIYDDDPQNIEDAIDAYTRAMQLLPDDPEVTAALGTLLGEIGAMDDAERLFRLTLQLDPGDHVIRQRLGVLYMQQNRLQDAHAQFAEAVRTAPSDDRAQLSLGVVLTRMSRDDDAVAPLRAAVAVNPKLGEGWLQLAGIHMRQDDTSAAIETLRRGTLANQSDARLWIALGQVLEQTSQRDEAVTAYKSAVDAAPQALVAWMALGQLIETSGDDAGALAVYQQAQQAVPGAIEPLVRAAWLLATSDDDGVRDGEQAMRLMQRVATVGAAMNQPEQLHVLAAAQARVGRYSEALASARRALTGAEVQGKDALTDEIRESLASYEAGQPYTRGKP